MIATILTIIAYLLPLVVEGLRTQKEKNKGHDHDTNIQQFRTALSTTPAPPYQGGEPNNLDVALADQHDRVLEAIRGSERGGEGNYHEGIS